MFPFWPGRPSRVRADATSARPLAPGTVLPAASASSARGTEWGFLTDPTVSSLLFGFIAGVWWTLWLARAMAPESLVTALYLIVRERRAAKVFWYDAPTPEREPAGDDRRDASRRHRVHTGSHRGNRSGRKSASNSSLSPSRISAASRRPITGPSVMPLWETAS